MKSLLARLARLPFLPHGMLFLLVPGLLRLGLLVLTGAQAVPLIVWPQVLLRGFCFDLIVTGWVLLPMLVWAAIWPTAWRQTRVQGPLRLAGFFVLASILLFVALAEWTFWDEFATRFNFIAVDYLVYTQEVLKNILESYPVGRLIGGILLLALLLTGALRRWILAAAPAGTRAAQRCLFGGLVLPLALLAWFGSNVDRMEFSVNTYANELSGNGMMTFFAAFRRNELDYARFYKGLPASQVSSQLKGMGVPWAHPSQPGTPSSDPSPLPTAFLRAPRNVVLITVESLSAQFLGSFGNKEQLTPSLDKLGKEGLLFTNLYATGTRTVRGLEALTIGIPPIPGQSIVRRPGHAQPTTLGEVLGTQGYNSYFLYGGYGYFDNMNEYYSDNGYQVLDRKDFPKADIGFSNAWGVADEYLLDQTLVQMDKAHTTGKPFLAQVMTTSNHRPFTYPDGRIDIPSPGGRSGAIKYTDYAIGRFIEQAKRKPWFSDTLFVVVADHCASAAGRTKLPVPGFHIPAIFYGPELVKPGRFEGLASQIDLIPTLLHGMGLKGEDHFFGRSLFRPNPSQPRAFISNYLELGYLTEGHLVVLGPKQRVEGFRISPEGLATPELIEDRLRDEAIAYYQGAAEAYRQGRL